MKRLCILLAAALCCLSTRALAQEEYVFPDHEVALQQMVKEWHGQNLYTAGWDKNPGIRNYFVGLADAYPNDFFQKIVHKMLGFDVDNAFFDFVLDPQNGYVSAVLGTETSPSVQMCYWRCKDGSRLIGVAVQGYEYNLEESDPSWTDEEIEDHIFVDLNDLAFFRILGDELIWRPVSVKELCGRDFDFKLYDIALPRQGKDIRLTDRDEDSGGYLLKWDGARFSVSKQ